jgi:hypothetical protein
MYVNMVLSPSSGEYKKGRGPTLVGPLEKAGLHLRTETDPVSEMLCFKN